MYIRFIIRHMVGFWVKVKETLSVTNQSASTYVEMKAHSEIGMVYHKVYLSASTDNLATRCWQDKLFLPF